MTLPDCRPRWRIDRRFAYLTSGALSLVIDVLSGVPLRMRSPRRSAGSASAPASRFAPHPLLYCVVRSPVQIACPERSMPAAWRAFAARQAGPCAAPPGHRIPVSSGREKMQGKIEGSGTLPAHERVCTWGWRGTRLWAALCREGRQSLVGIGESACMARRDSMAFAGATP
ncbi:hypothetical protein [Ottowia thiooxydans]|uniref:hypothetical protein n=1 Tax=Ottowia thiooxydans TaxID=219182 RepID=UPI00041F079A|nr:hypothetical protein [Ottowia thiooxydans]